MALLKVVAVGEVLGVLPGLDVGFPARILNLLKYLVVCEDFLFLHLHIKLSPYVTTAELARTLSFEC